MCPRLTPACEEMLGDQIVPSSPCQLILMWGGVLKLYLQIPLLIWSTVTCPGSTRKLISKWGFEFGFPASLCELLNNQISGFLVFVFSFYSCGGQAMTWKI